MDLREDLLKKVEESLKKVKEAMERQNEVMGRIYARQIHRGEITLDDVTPQTEDYRNYVRNVYNTMFPNDPI